MPSATSSSQAPRIPAWKRLGLKLKSEQGLTTTEQPAIEPLNKVNTPKRKRDEVLEEFELSRKSKKSTLLVDNPITPKLVRKKSVTFTPETKIDDGDSIKQLFNSWVTEQKLQDPDFELKTSSQVFDTPEPIQVQENVDPTLPEKERRVKRVKVPSELKGKIKSKKSKLKKEPKISNPAKSTPPFLSYLRQYSEDRPNWKFNKNHQTHIIKNVFELGVIPSDHAHFIYEYVRGLQGGVRTRLRDAALAIKVKHLEEGAAAYPDTMPVDTIKKKKEEYDRACNAYVMQMTALNASSRMGYEEGKLLGLSDYDMRERVAKRTRAEQILAELPSTGEGPVGGNGAEPSGVDGDNDSQKRLRMNDGSSRKVVRKRKSRTMVESDSSSSSESSDSDSEDSSSEESDAPRSDDTSSSSSSSSSEEDSDSSDSDDDSDESSESESN